MPQGHIEHANLTVSDPERSAALLQQLCGWHERWRGPSLLSGWSLHVGNDSSYIALYSGNFAGDRIDRQNDDAPRFRKGQPLNHVGLVVDDLAAAEAVVVEAGLEPFGHDDYDPGRRFYFFDWDGIEFEMVCYE